MLISLFLCLSCTSQPQEMPTQTQISKEEGFSQPSPLYQLLYSSQPLPQPSLEQQRLRALIWLKKMNLNKEQLQLLQDLQTDLKNRKKEIVETETQASQKILEEETPIYNTLWDALKEGKNLKDQEEEIAKLRNIRKQDNAYDIQKLRIDSIKAIFDAQTSFLQTLSPEQELLIIEALFFLRHHLDPIGTPSDFYALIGKTYEPGQYAVLVRGGSKKAQEEMNIGGLWTDKNELSGKALHEAKKELILYLALMEPGFQEAIQVALETR